MNVVVYTDRNNTRWILYSVIRSLRKRVSPVLLYHPLNFSVDSLGGVGLHSVVAPLL